MLNKVFTRLSEIGIVNFVKESLESRIQEERPLPKVLWVWNEAQQGLHSTQGTGTFMKKLN